MAVNSWPDDYTTNLAVGYSEKFNDFKDTAVDRYEKVVVDLAALNALTGVFAGMQVFVTDPGALFVFDGTAWKPVSAFGQFADGAGGGNLTTGWTSSTNPASLTLGPGVWMIAASIQFVLSTANHVVVEAHLFRSTGTAIGSGQGSSRDIPQASIVGTASFTADFTRVATFDSPITVQIFRRTSAGGGTQSTGTEHLIATRIA